MSEEHNIKDDEFIIPIDAYIQDFRTHLESHPRTIFSAKFGDGKSYFLNKIQEDKSFADYTFLTIHPINYQVESNKDIFELVKSDVLFQMINKNMIDKNYVLEGSAVIPLFSKEGKSIADFFIKKISELHTTSDIFKSFINAYKDIKLFSSLETQYKQYKEEGSINYFLKNFQKSKENEETLDNDFTSKIIRDNIKLWHKKEGKKVVLIFEDMDRIDPAHLFRIMNVLSAQMDLPYITKDNPNDTLNKYGFDNIVLVLDYENLIKIFRHFYGSETDFIGYISKFSPRGMYNYSFKDICYKYILRKVSLDICPDIRQTLSELITPDIIKSIDLRRIFESLKELDKQIFAKAKVEEDRHNVFLGIKILRITVFLLRLGFNKVEITNIYEPFLRENIKRLSLFPFYFKENKENFGIKIDNVRCHYISNIHISYDENQKEMQIKYQIDYAEIRNVSKFVTYEEIVSPVFNYISQ